MKWLSLVFFVLFIRFGAAAPAPLIELSNVTKPSDDPFYTPKPGYEKLKLGDVIDYRKITHPYGIVIFQDNVAAAYQFLVRSEDSHGNPSWVTTTLLVPHNADPNKLLSYHMAIDSSSTDCASSYAMQLGSAPATWITSQIELALVNAGLMEGWYVVVPDFLGPRSAFVAAYQASHASLNSIRAILNSGDLTGINKNAEVTLWGYSGGSQPTLWAAAIQPTYAPEINLIGAAAGGALIDPFHIMNYLAGTFFSGFLIAGVNGLGREYPELMNYINQVVYPSTLKAINGSSDACVVGALLNNLYTTWDSVSPLGSEIITKPAVYNVVEANNLLRVNATPTVPIYLYNSVNDQIIPANDSDALYEKWCGDGVKVTYNQDYFSEHISQAVLGSGLALKYLEARYKHEPITSCTRTNRFTNLEVPGSLAGLGQIAKADAFMLMGHDIGANVTANSGFSIALDIAEYAFGHLFDSEKKPSNPTVWSNASTTHQNVSSTSTSTSTSGSGSGNESFLSILLGSMFGR